MGYFNILFTACNKRLQMLVSITSDTAKTHTIPKSRYRQRIIHEFLQSWSRHSGNS